MLVRPLIPRFCCAPAWVLPALCTTLLASGHETDLSGVYQATHRVRCGRRSIPLTWLRMERRTLTTKYIGKDSVTMLGRWTQSGRQIGSYL